MLMDTITIFNLFANISIIAFLAYKYNPFWICITRTIWMKKILSISIMYRYKTYYYGHAAISRTIFTLIIRDQDKWKQWDIDQYIKRKLSKNEP